MTKRQSESHDHQERGAGRRRYSSRSGGPMTRNWSLKGKVRYDTSLRVKPAPGRNRSSAAIAGGRRST